MLGVLAENLLCLLAFDDKRAALIRGTVDVNYFGGQYKAIAARIYDYIDRYRKPPKAHLPDLLDDKLNSGNKREADLYRDVISSIHETYSNINPEYVMGQLETFVKRQSLRSIAIDLTKALQRDTEESLEEAEQLIRRSQQSHVSVFDPGTRLSDKKRALDFLDMQVDCFPTGIPELDKRGFGPTRKEQWLFMARTKKGKTWALIQLAKMAAMRRLRVCHISLEMSEERAAQRYFQSILAMAKRKESLRITKFKRDSLNRIEGLEDLTVMPDLTLDDPKIREKLEAKIVVGKRVFDNIIIKQFPTGQLTVSKLVAYLDNLVAVERFMPDLLIVDYPDLMKVSKDNVRLSLDEISKELRGLAIERNFALAVVTQTHRDAARAKTVGLDNAAEAYSKTFHADCIITYSQTDAEQVLGLARLHVAGGRNDQDGITIVISQQYGLGSFVIDSALMKGTYWEHIPKSSEVEDD